VVYKKYCTICGQQQSIPRREECERGQIIAGAYGENLPANE